MSIYVWIDRRDLAANDACARGLALFDAVATLQGRKTKIRLTWTPLAFVWASKSGFLDWLFQKGFVPLVSIRGADLQGADLHGADLHGADLHGADLRGADLGGADLGGADLQGADLGGAYRGGAYLQGADLQEADLRGADLGGWGRDPDGFARRRKVVT